MMPIYDLKCPSCEAVKRDVYCRHYEEKVKCSSCQAVMRRLVSRFNADVFPADGIFLEHVGARGKLFRSKQEMRDHEKATGDMLGCLH